MDANLEYTDLKNAHSDMDQKDTGLELDVRAHSDSTGQKFLEDNSNPYFQINVYF